MKTNSIYLFLIVALLNLSHTILGMSNNGLSPMAQTLQKASLNGYGGRIYYNVLGFRKAFQDNASRINANDLYNAYMATKNAIINLEQEHAICDRDYAAAFIAFNTKYPGSFHPSLIQQCQRSAYQFNQASRIQLHIAAHRWGEQSGCKDPEHAHYNWPSI